MPYRNPPWLDLLDGLVGIPGFGSRPLTEAERQELIVDTYERLKIWTGVDFGYDVVRWHEWMEANPEWFLNPEADARIGYVEANDDEATRK